jgi:D-sedoheptulose 7-phosphate isomerase
MLDAGLSNPEALAIAEELVKRYPALLPLMERVVAVAGTVVACHRRGGLVLVCGNGGSAADSGHIVAELAKGFRLPRRPSPETISKIRAVAGAASGDSMDGLDKLQRGVRAIDLAGATALNTAVINDLAGDLIFAQSVFVYGRPGDVLIAISTSGNSVNVLKALRVARAHGLTTVGLTGQKPSKMDDACDIVIKAPASVTHEIQEFHLPIYHAVCAMIEQELFA